MRLALLGLTCLSWAADPFEARGDKAFSAHQYRKAESFYRQAGERGNPSAQNKLANLYASPAWMGKRHDPVEAYSWALLSAASGFSKGVAAARHFGKGLPPSQKALAQKRAAARHAPGFAARVEGLGLLLAREERENAAATELYRKGVSLLAARNATAALEAFQRSARAGSARAALNAAVMLYKGDGVPRDLPAAAAWMRAAAESGYSKAEFMLGWFYETGKGVPQNDAEASAWYSRARAGGHPDAERALARLPKS